MVKQVLLAVAGLILIGATVPATAFALTKQQANAVALRALHPQARKSNVILFGLPRPVPAKSRIVPADPPKGKPGKTVHRRVAPLRHATWLYWLDQAPYAMFSHPSTYLLVDDVTGRVTKRAAIRWYPTVNGKRPVFVTPKGYRSKGLRVYSRVKRRTSGADAPFVSLSWPLANIPPGALQGECVLIVSDYSDPTFISNVDTFASWSRELKIPTFYSTASGLDPFFPGPSSKPPGKDTLRDNATELIVKHHCTDILIYMTGHGVSASDGPPMVATRNTIVETADGVEQQVTGVTADELYYAISLHPSTGFKVKIDSCFSGRFLDDFAPQGAGGKRESKLKNLLVMETSSSATSLSANANPEVDGNDNPNNLGEFTNQNLTGLEMFFSSQTDIAEANAQGGSLMEHALDRAFDLGASVNHGIDPDGNPIVPLKFTNFGPEAPKLKPIHGVFNSGTFTTTYTEDATGEGLSYAWSAKFDADTPCLTGFKGGSPLPNQATWYHADTSIGGPCGHKPTQLGARGHNGTVTVVVSNADWTCTATYFGTQGDNGKATGDGDPPQPCKRR